MLNVIICANFGVEKLRGLGNTRGQILEFPIEMAGHPYNSAALPRSLWYIERRQRRRVLEKWTGKELAFQTLQISE